MWLAHHGHEVGGLALDPLPGSLFERADVVESLAFDQRADIRDQAAVLEAVYAFAPDVLVHMAAQSLVRPSYAEPRLTVETNVLGTLSVLEALSKSNSAKAAIIVTTDKVYRNVGSTSGYVEDDPLGGHDPYSASKAMADILTSSWAASFPGRAIATARAGNVIGGGDISTDRLLPDVFRALRAKETVRLRNPNAVRPWQHVLDCLSGYLSLVDALRHGLGDGSWNFGPDPSAVRTVRETADLAIDLWGRDATWEADTDEHQHEAEVLTLDASKARSKLGWNDRLDYRSAIEWTVEWERRVVAGESPASVTLEQIVRFEDLGRPA